MAGKKRQKRKEKEKNRQKLQKQKTSFLTLRKLAVAFAAGAISLFSGYESLNFYYDLQIGKRLELCGERSNSAGEPLAGLFQCPARPDFTFLEKRAYVHRMDSIDSRFENNLSYFESVLNSNKEFVRYISKLSDSDREVCGVIEIENGAVQLKISPPPIESMYLDEILAGDFSHKEEAAYHLQFFPQMFGGLLEDDANYKVASMMPSLINLLENYHIAKNNVGCRDCRVSMLNTSKGNIQTLTPEEFLAEFGEQAEDTLAVMKNLREVFDSVSFFDIDRDFLSNQKIFSRFHTHPKDSDNPLPSLLDEANTFISGPNILFTQKGGELCAYAIHDGTYDEIYRQKLQY